MELVVVMAQRKERYVGQYAPEALAVMTACSNDENPAYLQEVLKENRDSEEFNAVELIRLEVDDDALMAALFPQRKPIKATVTLKEPKA